MIQGALRVESAAGDVVVDDDREHVVRAHEQTLRLDDDAGSSPVQAALTRQADGRWRLTDRGCDGGTWLRGNRQDEIVIDTPVTVRFGGPDGPALMLTPLADRPGHATSRNPAGTLVSSSTLSELTTIGRATDNDIVVNDLMVARSHATLTRSPDGRLVIRDANSRTGTFVNGKPIRSHIIDEGDVIGIGHHELIVRGDTLEDYEDHGAITLAASAVSVTIGDHTLVDGVGFVLGERTMLGVVGPSGAGKSSLLAALGGLRPLKGGHVYYEGRDLHEDYAELSSRIGFVPQADLLHDGLTVTDTLDYAARLRFPTDVDEVERAERISDVLAELGIGHCSGKRVSELSGGERKRVNVATELLTRPSLLLLDEPASGLDAGLERTLMRLLRDLADADHTVVVVTHELDSLNLCDQVLVLAPGGVPAYIGPPDGLEERFAHGDLVETFFQLGIRPDDDWRDPNSNTTVDGSDTAPAPAASAASHSRVSQWLRHVNTLTRRAISVLAADRRNLALLVLQAPLLGLIMLVALPENELSVPALTQVRFVSAAGLVLFVILLGASWLGANNAIREIA